MNRYVMYMISLVVLICCNGHQLQQGTVEIFENNGQPILIDGNIRASEWVNATRIELGTDLNMLICRESGHIFLAIMAPNYIAPSTDLFLSGDDGKIHHLHVSAQLGERSTGIGDTTGLARPFDWGRTRGWYANEIRFSRQTYSRFQSDGNLDPDAIFAAALYEYDGHEFHFEPGVFPNSGGRLRVEVGKLGTYDQPIIFPLETTRYDTSGWLRLVFP